MNRVRGESLKLERYSRRDFLAGVLASGTISAAALYLAPGGRRYPSVDLTLLTGTDSTGARQLLVDMWNKVNPDTTVSLKSVTGSTADQRDQMISAAGSGAADILNLDIINIPDFASRGLITAIEAEDVSAFVPKTLAPSRVVSDPTRYWALPFNADVGMLFERLSNDQPEADTSERSIADALNHIADGSRQFVGQLRPLSSSSDEAFLINVFEHALSQDSQILNDEGIPEYDLPRWQHALQPLRAALASHRITQRDNEDDSREAFRTQRLRYMRNWPVQYRKLEQDNDPDVKAARIRVGSLPAGILGGQSLAVVKKSAHASRAIPVIRYLTDEPAQKLLAAHGFAPTRIGAYSDPNLSAFIPYLEHMRGAVEQARLRPIHPNYGQFSGAVVRHLKNLLLQDIELPSQFTDGMRDALRSQ